MSLRVTRMPPSDLPFSMAVRWDVLAGPHPCRTWDWLNCWWDAYRGGRELYVLKVEERGQCVGLLPLCLEKSLAHGRSLRWLGSGKAASDDMGILVEPGREPEVCQAVAQWIAQAAGEDRWDLIDLDGIAANDSTMAHLRLALEAQGVCVQTLAGPSCWALEVPANWTEYLGRLVRNSRRIARHLDAHYLQAGRTCYRVATDRVQAEDFFAAIKRLHQKRWAARNVRGCFAHPHFEQFAWNLVERMFPLDQIHLALLEIDGRCAAGSLGILNHQIHSIYITAMDPDLAEHRPGWLLQLSHMRHAIAAGLREIDFMRGDEDYKRRLGGRPRPQQRWLAAAPRLLPRARLGAYRAAASARRWLVPDLTPASGAAALAATPAPAQ